MREADIEEERLVGFGLAFDELYRRLGDVTLDLSAILQRIRPRLFHDSVRIGFPDPRFRRCDHASQAYQHVASHRDTKRHLWIRRRLRDTHRILAESANSAHLRQGAICQSCLSAYPALLNNSPTVTSLACSVLGVPAMITVASPSR